jgi:hypothetical protein
MLLSHHQNAGQNHDVMITNRCFENVAGLKYLRTTVTNQNLIQEEMKRFFFIPILFENCTSTFSKWRD